MASQSTSPTLRAAAAGIAACSLAGNSEPVQAETVWTPGPSELIGSYTGYMQRDPAEYIVLPDAQGAVDFDGDGLDDFHFFFYFDGFRFRTFQSTSTHYVFDYNPTAEVIAEYDTAGLDSYRFGVASKFQSRQEVLVAAQSYQRLVVDEYLTNVTNKVPDDNNASLYTIGLLFDGADGTHYVGYVDVLTHRSFLGPEDSDYVHSLAIYDVGYARLDTELSSDGDTDGDGDVDNTDLQAAIANFTGPQGDPPSFIKTIAEGDTDGDGDVDNTDLQAAIANFTGPLNNPVPEPASVAVLMMSGGLLLGRRRRA